MYRGEVGSGEFQSWKRDLRLSGLSLSFCWWDLESLCSMYKITGLGKMQRAKTGTKFPDSRFPSLIIPVSHYYFSNDASSFLPLPWSPSFCLSLLINLLSSSIKSQYSSMVIVILAYNIVFPEPLPGFELLTRRMNWVEGTNYPLGIRSFDAAGCVQFCHLGGFCLVSKDGLDIWPRTSGLKANVEIATEKLLLINFSILSFYLKLRWILILFFLFVKMCYICHERRMYRTDCY